MADATSDDQQFGRLASEKQDEADALAAKDEGPEGTHPEGEGEDPRPRAGGKASEGAPPAADDDEDEAAKQTFPASDPPGNY